MKFGVIFTVDTDDERELESAEQLADELGMRRTEGDDCSGYHHVFGDDARHRKFTGVLSPDELQQLAGELALYPNGARGPVLGVPGGGILSTGEGTYFTGRHTLSELCVTPYPELERVEPWPLSEREADRLFRAVESHFS